MQYLKFFTIQIPKNKMRKLMCFLLFIDLHETVSGVVFDGTS